MVNAQCRPGTYLKTRLGSDSTAVAYDQSSVNVSPYLTTKFMNLLL